MASLAFERMRNTLRQRVNHSASAQCACSLLYAVLMWPCYEFVSQSPLLPTIPPCIIMSSDPPPRRSSRLSNKRTVVSDDVTDSVAMTVTKRRGKRTDAGRCHPMTCTFVIDVIRIMHDNISSRCNIWKNSAQCTQGVVCRSSYRWLCVKNTPGNAVYQVFTLWVCVLYKCVNAWLAAQV